VDRRELGIASPLRETVTPPVICVRVAQDGARFIPAQPIMTVNEMLEAIRLDGVESGARFPLCDATGDSAGRGDDGCERGFDG